MKRYNITVNGTSYEVIVEEVDGSSSRVPTYTAPVAAASTESAPKTTKTSSSTAAGANKVTAPMPGTILEIKVSVGQSVKKGDVICVLEAMKMENDIMAPADGVVASIEAAQGASVATDAVLVTLN